MVRSTPTGLPKLYGAGPVITAIMLGEVGDVARFHDRHHFASYNGTAPDDKGSAGSPAHCVNTKGNRKLNHAIHMIAITQIRNPTLPAARTTNANSLNRRRRRKHYARSNEGSPTSSTASSSLTPNSKRAREAKRGRLSHPAWPTQPRRPALRRSHNPDPTRTLRLSPLPLDRGVPLWRGSIPCDRRGLGAWKGLPESRPTLTGFGTDTSNGDAVVVAKFRFVISGEKTVPVCSGSVLHAGLGEWDDDAPIR